MTNIKWRLNGQGCLNPSAQAAGRRQSDLLQVHPARSPKHSRRKASLIKSSRLLIRVLRQAYQQKRCAARIYQALAERERDQVRQRFLVALAVHAERQAWYYAYRLKRLKAAIPTDNDGLVQHLWRWVLVRGGVKLALAWIERGERRYIGLLTSLACA